MSQATRATTAEERARIAAGFIRRGTTRSRSFADCFEMGDGAEVVAILTSKAATDPRIADYAHAAGWARKPDLTPEQRAEWLSRGTVTFSGYSHFSGRVNA